MDELALKFFPYPHVFKGKRHTGALHDWPDVCSSCDRQCERKASEHLQLCSYGLNYVRASEDVIVAGIGVHECPQRTPARAKRMREIGRDAIRQGELEAVLKLARQATDELEAEHRRAKDEIVAEFRNARTYQQEMVELLRPDLERMLGQVHDYKQFVQQIVQNMNVVLENRFPGCSLEEKLNRATPQERSIYWAAIVMDEKLDAALFLDSPERIREPREQGVSRLHGLVLKYLRIYQSRANLKRVETALVGESWSQVEGNKRALGIIPHTLIDNALKYAPGGTRVILRFTERADTVEFAVEGFGPKIAPEEEGRIFDLFFRGAAARAKYSEGTGFGLASAQNIARAHGTEIEVRQSDREGPEETFLTTFSVSFPRAT